MSPTTKPASKERAARRPLAATALTAAAVAVLAGCANPLHHSGSASTATGNTATGNTASPAATPSPAKTVTAAEKAALAARESARLTCAAQETWNEQAKVSVQALYADTGALAADAHAGNIAGVRKAGAKLAADAVAAATLSLPSVDAADWKTLTAVYASAGTALASGGAVSAVPQLETAGSALSAFTTAVAKCATAQS